MKQVWLEEHEVKSYEVNGKKELKLCVLFNLMQEAASNHSTNLNVGFNELGAKNLTWVLSRVKIKIHKYPRWEDKVTIQTWAKTLSRLTVKRDFTILEMDGSQIACATTLWAVIDIDKIKPQRIDTLFANHPRLDDKIGLDDPLRKIDITGQFYSQHQKLVTYSDIDINNHVNNSRYIQWIMDSIPNDYHENMKLDTLQINYLLESRLGDTLNIKTNIENQKTIYIEGENINTQNKIFQSKIEFKEL